MERVCSPISSPSFLTCSLSVFVVHSLTFMSLDLSYCRSERAMPLIIDPGLYQNTKSDIFWVAPRRTLPTAFKLFTGKILTCKSEYF